MHAPAFWPRLRNWLHCLWLPWLAVSACLLWLAPSWLELRWLAGLLWFGQLLLLRPSFFPSRSWRDAPVLWELTLPEPGLGGAELLVAAGEPESGRRLRHLLATAGYRCTLVRNGFLALQRLGAQEFDAALLAAELPLMSGLEVLRAHRFMQGPTPPILLLDAAPAARREGCLAGAAAVLAPSLDTTVLLQLLEALTARADAAPPPVPPTPSDVVLDLSVLGRLEQISAVPDFLDGLLLASMKDNRRLLRRLEETLRHGNFVECREILHAMRSSALSIGAHSLKAACRHYERMASTEMRQAGQGLYLAVQSEIERLEQEVRRYRQRRRRQGH